MYNHLPEFVPAILRHATALNMLEDLLLHLKAASYDVQPSAGWVQNYQGLPCISRPQTESVLR